MTCVALLVTYPADVVGMRGGILAQWTMGCSSVFDTHIGGIVR